LSKEAKRLDDLEQQIQQLKEVVSLLMNSDMLSLTSALKAVSGEKDAAQSEFMKVIDAHNSIRERLGETRIEVDEK